MTKLSSEIIGILEQRQVTQMQKTAGFWDTVGIKFNEWNESAALRKAQQIQDPEIRAKVEQGIKAVRGKDGSPDSSAWSDQFLNNPEFRDFANDYIYGNGWLGRAMSWTTSNVANVGAGVLSGIRNGYNIATDWKNKDKYIEDFAPTAMRGFVSGLDLALAGGAAGVARGGAKALASGAKALATKGMKEGLKTTGKGVGKMFFPNWKRQGKFRKALSVPWNIGGAVFGADVAMDVFGRNGIDRFNKDYDPEAQYDYNIDYPGQQQDYGGSLSNGSFGSQGQQMSQPQPKPQGSYNQTSDINRTNNLGKSQYGASQGYVGGNQYNI